MDKNIAALLREDAKTVHVVFTPEVELDLDEDSTASDYIKARRSAKDKVRFGTNLHVKTYTYVTDLDLVRDDIIVVEAQGRMQVAAVHAVDNEVKIDPNSDIYYQWVVAKVDMSGFEANVARNREIQTVVAQAYTKNLRKSFANQILSGLANEDEIAKVQALIGRGA